MIAYVESPPSSVLIEKRLNSDTGEDFVLITQINNVHYTKLSEFQSYFNEINKGGSTPGPMKRIVDSNFVALPLGMLRGFIEGEGREEE